MCNRCDNRTVTRRWTIWLSVSAVVLIFILTNVFMYGRAMGVFESHIKVAPTYEKIAEKFVAQGEFNTIKEMILFIYKQQGGQ